MCEKKDDPSPLSPETVTLHLPRSLSRVVVQIRNNDGNMVKRKLLFPRSLVFCLKGRMCDIVPVRRGLVCYKYKILDCLIKGTIRQILSPGLL